jgi:hypothetical protein
MGKGELFQTLSPFANVSVTDEKIVEVTPQSDREVVLVPRGIGSTNVFVLDEKNSLIARLDINVLGGPVKEEYGESLGVVGIYNRIYNPQGSAVEHGANLEGDLVLAVERVALFARL